MAFGRYSDGLRRFFGRTYFGPPVLNGISPIVQPSLQLDTGPTWDHLIGVRRASASMQVDAVAAEFGFAGIGIRSQGIIVELERLIVCTATTMRFRVGVSASDKGSFVNAEFTDARSRAETPLATAQNGTEAALTGPTDFAYLRCPANDTVQLPLGIVMQANPSPLFFFIEAETANTQFNSTIIWTERVSELSERR